MRTANKNKKGWLLTVAIVVAILVITTSGGKSRKYDKAAEYMWEGDYQAAIEIYTELGDYENSETLLLECEYRLAERLLTYREYRQAISAFDALGDYSDSKQKILECHYGLGEEAFRAEDYLEAYACFLLAEGHADAAQKADASLYGHGHQLFLEGDYAQAQTYFDRVTTQPDDAMPHFITLQDAREYLDEQAQLLSEVITCYVGEMPAGNPGDSDFELLCNYVPYQSGGVIYDGDTRQLRVRSHYYPGMRIVYAWRTGDHGILTEEEMKAMQVALDLVETAKAKYSKPIDVELYLYNWLCNHVEYESPDMDVDTETYLSLRQLNCLGALLDGKSNCQGYTDAFYLLGTMAGFDVCRISGLGMGGETKEPHSWNGITLDGKLYIVDVTFGDADNLGSTGKTYTWFNCAFDPDTYTVNGGTELLPELVTGDDLSQSYYKQKESVFTKLGDASYYLLRQYKKNGKGWTFAVVEDAKVTNKQLESSIKKNRSKAGVGSYKYTYMMEYYNGNTYIALKWK